MTLISAVNGNDFSSIEQWISEELTAMMRTHDSSLTVLKLASRTILANSFMRPEVACSMLVLVI